MGNMSTTEDADELKRARNIRQDQYLVVHFFLGAHQDRYRRLREEIKNNFPHDLNQWPRTLQELYDLLQTYIQYPKLQMKSVKEGERLMIVTKKEDEAQKTKDINTIKCFKYNKMGHYAR